MRKILNLITIVIFSMSITSCGSSSFQQTPDSIQNYTFRDTTWGSSSSKVEKVENNNSYRYSDSSLTYLKTSKCYGYNVILSYQFDKSDSLVSGSYVFLAEHTDKSDYLYDYETIRTSLADIYGKAKINTANWNKKVTDIQKEDFGQAIANGELTFTTRWVKGDNSITLLMGKSDSNKSGIGVTLLYQTKS